ncbi:hypothetical protein [Sphingomonas sp.]|jgi:hypothetical protein|uniref:hypothetical protein n=1 Tax=Sphingomonas sp. TaxID=28214 RepID=UPI002E34DA33|nr:hypothetical protein [Sphingomonas sp.]HEX4695675.1 hypothetical protein [Sphingomonas sp.]
MDPQSVIEAGRAAMLAAGVSLTPDFVSPQEQAELIAWAEAMEPHLKPNRMYRAYRDVRTLPDIPPIWTAVRQRVETLMALGDDPAVEPIFGLFLSIIRSGGRVHNHHDSSPPGTRHLRCNLFVDVPREGGRPIILRKAIDVAPRTLLAFYANEMRHASEVFDRDRRIVLSFGYTVPAAHRLPNAIGA